jgi:L-ascorbate metabolism protein UlaG (beta-lactamase superfamily)
LLTHEHSDHYQPNALRNLTNSSTAIITPLYVYQQMASNVRDLTNRVTVLTNGATASLMGLTVEAVPAYNLVAANHPKGRGNGYIVTIGGQRIYISGDTDNVPELAQLQNIDIAFVCMSPPYTMATNVAANLVRTFRPRIVYPYHYNAYVPAVFKSAVGTDLGIEVRLRKWE